MNETKPFWKTKTLEQMNDAEWESLCDGCGKCCLSKIDDSDNNRYFYTDIACHMLDTQSCRCKDYPNRKDFVPDCIQLTPQTVPEYSWMPYTCAYRLVSEGKDLYPWHPLISGDPETVHTAGISVRGKITRSDKDFDLHTMETLEVENSIIHWPWVTPEDYALATKSLELKRQKALLDQRKREENAAKKAKAKKAKKKK